MSDAELQESPEPVIEQDTAQPSGDPSPPATKPPLRKTLGKGGFRNPLDNLKIGMKVAVGSGSVLVLLLVVSVVAFFGLNGANGNFTDYRQLARQTNQMGRIQANLLSARLAVKDFILKGTEESAKEVNERILATEKLAEEAESLFEEGDNLNTVREMETDLKHYEEAFHKVQEFAKQRDALVEQMNTIGPKAEKDLTDIMQSAFDDGDAQASYLAGNALRHLLLARLYAIRFLVDNEEAQGKRVEKELKEFEHQAELMKDELQNPRRHELAVEVFNLAKQYEEVFEQVETVIFSRNDLIHETLDKIGPKVAEEVEHVKLNNKNAQDELGPRATAAMETSLWVATGVSLLALLLGLGLAYIVGRAISAPITNMTGAMTRLADGEKEIQIPGIGRKDEIGLMADAVEVFRVNAIEVERMEKERREAEERARREKEEAAERERRQKEEAAERERKQKEEAAERERREKEEADRRAEEEKKKAMRELADTFDAAVGGVINTVTSAATELQSTAETMSATAEETSRQSTAVAAASEEASANVQTVASATEEMSGSVAEIGRQVSQSTEIANKAVAEANRTNETVQGLAEAAQKIGEVVNLISDIAEQTNLLALNATIEAARAGDAGKGFAVVASEVKSLANQTAKATEEIASQIGGMQSVTGEAVDAIKSIGGTIEQISEIATAIASAVEEQGAATQEIARNVQEASKGTAEVSSNIGGVNQAASETGISAKQVLDAAGQLSKESENLRAEVSKFLDNVRAA